jgi:Uma2 family endonuclease
MNVSTRTPALTFDDFCLLVKDGQKADLINGVIYMASPDNTDANDLFVWLLRLLGDFVEEKDLGKVYGSRVAFRLGEGDGPEPDIAYVRKERLHLVQRGYVDGPPDLAIEIVSPESVERDYEDKRTQYQQAGVAEYWIIDEMEQKVTLLRLGRGRRYREVRPRSGELHSQVVPGFWLRPEWLWQDPRPRKTEVLTQLLAREDHP